MLEIVAHEVGLDVEDELPCETFRPCQHHFGLTGLGRRDLEDVAVDLVHGEKGGRIPQLVRINCRRFKPSDLPLRSANSLMRASTFFWIALCEGGKYSPFDTIWVGTGVAADAASAPATRRCSRSLSQLPIVRPPCLVIDQLPVVNGGKATPRICPNHDGTTSLCVGMAPRSRTTSAHRRHEPKIMKSAT